MAGDDGGSGDDRSDNGAPGAGGDRDRSEARDRPETLADDVDEARGTDDSTVGSDGQGPGNVTQPTTGGGQPTTGTGTTGGVTDATPNAEGEEPRTASTEQEGVETTVTTTETDDGTRLLAAIVSFLVPGVGNVITGHTERGVTVFVLWAIWFVVVGVIGVGMVGFFLSTILAFFTVGLSWLVWFLVIAAYSVVEFVIHVVAAVDAYQRSEIVDDVTVKVDQVRSE